MREEWRAVPGYEGLYEVSDRGRVRSLDRTVLAADGPRRYKGKIRRLQLQSGYPFVRLCRAGEYLDIAVHRLVAAAFIGPRPDGLHVNHRDGVKTNNAPANLEYVTREYNSFHAWRTGLCDSLRGESHYRSVLSNAQVVEAQRRVAAGEHVSGVAEEFGVKVGTLKQALGAIWLRLHNEGKRRRDGSPWV